MKIRVLPTLLLLGIIFFGFTQSVTGQIVRGQALAAVQTEAVSQPVPTPAVTTSVFTTTSPLQPTPPPTVSITETTLPVTTTAASSSAIFMVPAAAANIMSTSVDAIKVTDAISDQAVAVSAQISNAAQTQADPSVGNGPVLVDQLTRLDSPDNAFDLSKLRLENLAQIPILQTASAPETAIAADVAAKAASTADASSGGFYTGTSGIIPDATAKQLAEDPLAPKLWPVKGPITSPFGVRPVLDVPTSGTSPSGKGGAGPRVTTNTAATETQPTPTPTLTPTPTVASTLAVTTTPKITPTFTTAPVMTTPAPTATVPPTTQPATIQPAQAVTPEPVEVIQTPAIQLPTNTPEAASPTPTATTAPTTTPVISPTTTISPTLTTTPTPTPTATPFPSGPIPLINGSLGAVGPGEEFHTGEDIAVIEGTEVHATADGVVLYAGNGGGYGYVVFIQHPGGFVTVYGHNSRLLVLAGQTVKAGQTISLSGSTGYSTGPHVHYEVRYQGKIANPAYFLK